mmetsp:Transcript_42601/g.132530  ORF Transcript_42601/g.132530 Transcript_42601/m.132530 type:complete len:200 (-) Transcript_42601:48-647(-)
MVHFHHSLRQGRLPLSWCGGCWRDPGRQLRVRLLEVLPAVQARRLGGTVHGRLQVRRLQQAAHCRLDLREVQAGEERHRRADRHAVLPYSYRDAVQRVRHQRSVDQQSCRCVHPPVLAQEEQALGCSLLSRSEQAALARRLAGLRVRGPPWPFKSPHRPVSQVPRDERDAGGDAGGGDGSARLMMLRVGADGAIPKSGK